MAPAQTVRLPGIPRAAWPPRPCARPTPGPPAATVRWPARVVPNTRSDRRSNARRPPTSAVHQARVLRKALRVDSQPIGSERLPAFQRLRGKKVSGPVAFGTTLLCFQAWRHDCILLGSGPHSARQKHAATGERLRLSRYEGRDRRSSIRGQEFFLVESVARTRTSSQRTATAGSTSATVPARGRSPGTAAPPPAGSAAGNR